MRRKFRNMAEQLEYEHIQQLKSDKESSYRIKPDESCYIRILNRGEQLFYQENDKAFICEISVLYDMVFMESIKRWDTGKKITDEEKEIIRDKIIYFFKEFHKTDIKFV